MAVHATVKVDVLGVPSKIRRICKNRRVGSFAASEVERLAKPYVPFRRGGLRSSAVVSPFLVTYTAPYAHRQWEGIGITRRTTPGTVSHWEKYISKAALSQSVTQFLKWMV